MKNELLAKTKQKTKIYSTFGAYIKDDTTLP